MRRRIVGHGSRNGAAALEFALILPILLVLISAIADYGWYLTQQTQVLQAVGDGARMGITVSPAASPGPEDIALEHTQNVLSGLGIPCNDDDDCEFETSINSAGTLDVLTVKVTLNYQPIAGLVPYPEKIKAETSMAIEDQ